MLPHPNPGDHIARSKFRSYHRMRQEAEVVWAPESWTRSEQDQWYGLKSREKLCRLSALAGWIHDGVPVIPFSLDYWEEQLTRPRITGLTTQVVTVLLGAAPYIGSTLRMRSLCQEGNQVGKNGLNDWTFTARDGWDTFAEWKVTGGAQGLLEQFERIWKGEILQDTPAVVLYGSVKRSLFEAAHDIASLHKSQPVIGEQSGDDADDMVSLDLSED